MTQQFDEGMREIALGLLAIGTAPYSADKLKDFLDDRPEPLEQKIKAIDKVEDMLPASSKFHTVADDYIKQYTTQDTPPEPIKVKPNRRIEDTPPERPARKASPDSLIKNLASDLIKPSEIYGTDISDPRNKKFLKPYTDDVGIYTIGIGHKIGDGSKSAKNKWVQKYGNSISPKFAEKLFDKQLSYHLDRVKGIFDTSKMNEDQVAVLVDISYRGDLLPKMQWVDLIKKGKFKDAATEYLDHKEYKKRKAKGRDGVVKRMERNANILAN